jgi:AraC-like DNA-binding protein
MDNEYIIDFFSLGFSCGIWALLGIRFVTSNGSRLKKVTGWVLLLWMLLDLKDLLLYFHNIIGEREIMLSMSSLDFIVAPTCVFILHELVDPKWINTKRVMMHEIPFLLIGVIDCYADSTFLYVISVIGTIVYVAYNCFIFIGAKRKYDRAIKNEYSSTDTLNLRWLGITTVLFAIVESFWTLSFYYEHPLIDALDYFISTVLWVVVCYHVERQTVPESIEIEGEAEVRAEERLEEEIVPESVSVQELAHKYHFKGSFEDEFAEKELFKNPNLTINDVATELGTNRTYISTYINDCMNMTFYDYVNSKRIEHAENLLTTTNDTLPTISETSGFCSLSTFHRVFRNKHHCTPTQFRTIHAKKLEAEKMQPEAVETR